jgi:carbonic anhydrase
MPPEEFLVHRNPGCVVSNEDASTLSTVEWALRVSKVKHIVVCGHYGCRVVNCGRRDESMVEWLRYVGFFLFLEYWRGDVDV